MRLAALIDAGAFPEMNKSASPPGAEREHHDGQRVPLQAGSLLMEANFSLLPETLPSRQCLHCLEVLDGQF